jgi:UDP-N-acetylmuramoyl-L-alanyl-D-glutamate--2,6-diaminopimelate ligase
LANIAAAAATALATGVDSEAVGIGITRAAPVPGRLERVGDADPAVFVDYAHTPDALERTLSALRQLAPARVVVVFGCGGDRDRGKRSLMGGIAARLADVVVLTSDNPRSEDPALILAEIESGVGGARERNTAQDLARPGARGYLVEPDREAAIRLAIGLAEPADVVVIAGKGHEDYQEITGVRRPFDDREIAAALLRSR